MAEFGQLDIYGNLNIKGNLFIRNNIIQDDILYPKISVDVEDTTNMYIVISLLKKDNNKTTSSRKVNFSTNNTPYYRLMPARPLIHWWHSTTQYGAPSIIQNVTSLGITAGTMLEPISAATNAAIVRTTLSDQNHQVILKITGNLQIISGYTMVSIQGIVYSSEQW